MSIEETTRQETKRHVMTLLVASHRALNNALDDLGFEENDDRVVEHDGRLAFVTCSHEPDCDDLFALIAELEIILAANDVPVKFGAGVAAVQEVYARKALAKEAVHA